MKTKQFRFSAILLCIAILLAGCSPIVADVPQSKTIYTTIYPIYALAKMISDDVEGIELHCLLQPQDDCLRSYALSDWDLYILSYAADMLLSAGNGLESFEEQLEEMGENALPVAEVLYGLDTQEFVQSSDEESHFSGENPYLYMSIDGASAIIENIYVSIMLLDPENSVQYEHNYGIAQSTLESARHHIKKTTEVCSGASCAIMHETLFYTAIDCNLSISAWYERESGEMLYGNDLEKCIDDFKKNSVELVLIENQAPQALIDALEQAGYTVVKLDILSTLKESDGASAYLNALKNNADLIAEACAQQ